MRQQADACLAMAHAAYDLAEQCDDPDELRDHLEVAGRWFRMADKLMDRARALDSAGRLDPQGALSSHST
jgi:hypothetical protein